MHIVFVQKPFSSFTLSDIEARLGTEDFPPMEMGRVVCNNGIYLEAPERILIAVGLTRYSMAVFEQGLLDKIIGFLLYGCCYPFSRSPSCSREVYFRNIGNRADKLFDRVQECTRNEHDGCCGGQETADVRRGFPAGYNPPGGDIDGSCRARLSYQRLIDRCLRV